MRNNVNSLRDKELPLEVRMLVVVGHCQHSGNFAELSGFDRAKVARESTTAEPRSWKSKMGDATRNIEQLANPRSMSIVILKKIRRHIERAARCVQHFQRRTSLTSRRRVGLRKSAAHLEEKWAFVKLTVGPIYRLKGAAVLKRCLESACTWSPRSSAELVFASTRCQHGLALSPRSFCSNCRTSCAHTSGTFRLNFRSSAVVRLFPKYLPS